MSAVASEVGDQYQVTLDFVLDSPPDEDILDMLMTALERFGIAMSKGEGRELSVTLTVPGVFSAPMAAYSASELVSGAVYGLGNRVQGCTRVEAHLFQKQT